MIDDRITGRCLTARSSQLRVRRPLLRTLMCFAAVVASSSAQAESHKEILERVRANGTAVFLRQASWTLPDSFHNSGLASSDKERLIKEWADESSRCLADALAEYAKTTDVPLAEMVSEDGSFRLLGDGASSEFSLRLETCVERAWAAVGAGPR